MNKNQVFNGKIDEFGFPFLIVDILNPKTEEVILNAKAIIDTGAAYSHIKKEVIRNLKLTSSKEVIVKHAVDGEVESGIFNINIIFNKKINVPNIDARLLHTDYPSDLIIGLDIIKYCNFQYNSKNKTFSFQLFPNP